jgi:hypothetical protein
VGPLAFAFRLTFALMAEVERRDVRVSAARPPPAAPFAVFLPPPRRLFCAVFFLLMPRPTQRAIAGS